MATLHSSPLHPSGHQLVTNTSTIPRRYADSKKNPAPPRRKRERRDRDPKAPKSATSAYMYFSKHHRMLLKQENADLSFGDLGKTVGAMWKAATPEEKRPFEELAAEDRARYLSELSQYKELTATLEKVGECASVCLARLRPLALPPLPPPLPRVN